VEIDLLRSGPQISHLSTEQLNSLRPWQYLVTVTRRGPTRHAVYAFPLTHRLPRISIPLGGSDSDVVLDLQIPFNRSWDEGPYPQLLRYDRPPPGPMSPDLITWCEDIVTKAGYRQTIG
jgi:hypothetical protein